MAVVFEAMSLGPAGRQRTLGYGRINIHRALIRVNMVG
jgi:hypothetical protein